MNAAKFPRLVSSLSLNNLGSACAGNDSPLPDHGLVTDWDPREIAVFQNSPDGRDLFEDFAQPRFVISAKFQQLLSRLVPERIQCLPIRFQSDDGKLEYPGFSILRVLRVLALREASNATSEYDLFKIPFSDRRVHVTVALRDAILEAGICGVEFDESDPPF